MSRDISPFGYNFPENKACLVCEDVFAGHAIRVVVHDADGWLQFTAGKAHPSPGTAKVVALSELINHHQLEGLPKKLKAGEFAEVTTAGGWKVSRIDDV